jgi:hypothetical protein
MEYPEKKEGTGHMTNTDDILRQIETTLGDTCYPPTLKEKEILTTMLYQVSAGNAEFRRDR